MTTARPSYYPICLALSGRPCLVVGGGRVAQQKVKTLLRYEASVTVVSPALTPVLQRWAGHRKIRAQRRPFHPGDVRGQWLVYGATDDPAVQRAVFRAATRRKAWVNIVDKPSLCTFIAPAQVKRGDLTIAITTGGRAPGLAKRVRQKIERTIGPEYGILLRKLERTRLVIRQTVPTVDGRKRAVHRVLEREFGR